MFVLPQSRPTGAAPFGHIPTLDPTGRGVPLAALAGTPDHVLRAKFPAVAQALDHFAKLGGSKFWLKITVSTLARPPSVVVADRERRDFHLQWAGYEAMNFSQEMQGAGLVKGVALAFDRFLRVRPASSLTFNHSMILTCHPPTIGGDRVRWTPACAELAPTTLRAARSRAHRDHHVYRERLPGGGADRQPVARLSGVHIRQNGLEASCRRRRRHLYGCNTLDTRG